MNGGSSDLPMRRDGEVVLVMGLPGAGKSTVARDFVAQGYARLNRDEAGGSLRDLLPALERLDRSGRLAGRARQHLRLARIAGAGRSGGDEAWLARALRLALDEHRSRAGERSVADGVEVRPPARAGRDAQDRQARRQRVSTRGAVPPSTRARASGSIRRLLANRDDALRANA